MEGGQSERKVYPVAAVDYTLLEEIGQGVSATVFRALCVPYNEVVAIKSLDLEKCNSSLDDIRREAVTMSLINHPNVVKAYCSFVVDRNLWVVMPYMAGGSCLHIMKAAFSEGFEEPVIATVLKESLKALEYLHRHGHIHRDVKAGNILVDGNGAVKLGDFGVSACMFDTGDRQRSRKTFVGTPCWMAPEVMEQLHGYDFKADIWSFGITALELAHGHAPFSKYPPMKVLLMTLQNAPPGLDYDRDKKFSKSFKEMIAMCLVKEPTKRPTAEKLLRHSFFKHARTSDYIYRHVLEGLPSLGERVKNLKISDAARLAEKKLPFGEQEERSQTEYKRGVSSWNFNVEDLKAESALIPDDDDTPPQTIKEDDGLGKQQAHGGSDDSPDASPQFLSPSQLGQSHNGSSSDRLQPPVILHTLKAEVVHDAEDCVTRVRSGPLPRPVQPTKSTNGAKSILAPGRKEPKHIGRFDVFEDDLDVLESPGWHGSPSAEQGKRDREEKEHRKVDDRDRRDEQREHKFLDERERDESRKGGSGPLVPERVLSSVRGRDEDREREKEHRQSGRSVDDSCRHRAFSGPLLPSGERAASDYRLSNGVSRPSGSKEGAEDKLKGPTQKAGILQKGRFSVTSDDADEEPSHVNPRRPPSSQGSQQQLPIPASSSASNLNSASVPVVAIVPHLQNALQLAVMQHDALMHIMNCINPNESNSLRMMNGARSSRSSCVNISSDYAMVDSGSDREKDLQQQIIELQGKYSSLLEEYQTMKLKNISLERQLNAIYNKEEEERIRREEAAQGDG